jgi:hypothetical protein
MGTNAAVLPDAVPLGAALPDAAAVGPGADEELEPPPPHAARVPISAAKIATPTSLEGFANRTTPDPHLCRIGSPPHSPAPYFPDDPR